MIPKEIQNMKPLKGNERLGMTRDSDYLGAEDIFPSDAEPVLTVQAIYNGLVTLQRGKENKDVIVFKESSVPGIKEVRPLIVNATNRKTLRKLFKSVTADTLVGKRISLYIDHNVRDPQTGELTDGIRIRPRIPADKKAEPIICADCGKPIVAIQKFSAEQIAMLNEKRYGRKICGECSKKLAEAKAAEEAEPETEEEDDTVMSVSAEELEGTGGIEE